MEGYDYNYANYIFYCRYVRMKVALAANNYSDSQFFTVSKKRI